MCKCSWSWLLCVSFPVKDRLCHKSYSCPHVASVAQSVLKFGDLPASQMLGWWLFAVTPVCVNFWAAVMTRMTFFFWESDIDIIKWEKDFTWGEESEEEERQWCKGFQWKGGRRGDRRMWKTLRLLIASNFLFNAMKRTPAPFHLKKLCWDRKDLRKQMRLKVSTPASRF